MFNYKELEVKHGITQVGFAYLTQDLSGFEAPQVFEGVTNFEPSVDQEQNKYYADNVNSVTLNGVKQTTGTTTVYSFPESFALGALGFKKMANGGLVDTGRNKPFAFFYIQTIESDVEVKEEMHIFYNVKAGALAQTATTDTESVEPVEIEIPFTMSASRLALDSEGQPVTEMILVKDDLNASLFDQFSTKVILPTDTPTPQDVVINSTVNPDTINYQAGSASSQAVQMALTATVGGENVPLSAVASDAQTAGYYYSAVNSAPASGLQAGDPVPDVSGSYAMLDVQVASDAPSSGSYAFDYKVVANSALAQSNSAIASAINEMDNVTFVAVPTSGEGA